MKKNLLFAILLSSIFSMSAYASVENAEIHNYVKQGRIQAHENEAKSGTSAAEGTTRGKEAYQAQTAKHDES